MNLLNSKIIVSKNIKMDRELKNVLDYSPQQLLNLMSDENHLVASDNYYSFIRTETGLIQTHFDYNQILHANYIAFQNYDYSNKWFFAFIDEVIFKGPANTEIRFTIDPFSTFNKDLNYGNSYVIREHVNDDTIGANTVPENLETGEMIQEGDTLFITDLGVSYWVAVETDCHPLGESVINPNDPQIVKFGGISRFNKLISGHEILVFKTSGDLGRFIERMGRDDVADSIKSMFIVPTAMFNNVTLLSNFAYDSTTATNRFDFYGVPNSDNVSEFDATISKSYTFSGYTPKNNKCKVYPYNYLYISNNVGQDKILKYEDFSTSNCPMTVVGCLSVGGSYKLIPENYKGIAQNFDESVPLGKFPTCAWSSDSYTNWLTQQGVNEYAQSGTNIIQGAMQGAMVSGTHGAVAMAGINLAGEVSDWIGAEKEAKLKPNIVGGSNTGNVTWAIGGINFFMRRVHCKPEYMRIIDDYFTRFGYKVNRLKTPNITGRRYFNYVQIASSDDVASGSIPNIYMDEINKAFRKGITIWHDHNSIGNYSVSNTII